MAKWHPVGGWLLIRVAAHSRFYCSYLSSWCNLDNKPLPVPLNTLLGIVVLPPQLGPTHKKERADSSRSPPPLFLFSLPFLSPLSISLSSISLSFIYLSSISLSAISLISLSLIFLICVSYLSLISLLHQG